MKRALCILIPIAAVLLIGLCVFLIFFLGKENDPKMVENVVFTKTASPSVAQNVMPGDEIEYTVRVTNQNEKRCKLCISDVLPANTVYVRGDAEMDEKSFSLSVSLKAGENPVRLSVAL